MAKARPETAEELRTLVTSLLPTMSAKQQERFWYLISEHKDNWYFRGVLKTITDAGMGMAESWGHAMQELINTTVEYDAKLKKHRNPPKNTDRDAEIMALHAKKKTAGEIVAAMKGRFKMTDTVVRAVISRERKKPKN